MEEKNCTNLPPLRTISSFSPPLEPAPAALYRADWTGQTKTFLIKKKIFNLPLFRALSLLLKRLGPRLFGINLCIGDEGGFFCRIFSTPDAPSPRFRDYLYLNGGCVKDQSNGKSLVNFRLAVSLITRCTYVHRHDLTTVISPRTVVAGFCITAIDSDTWTTTMNQ